MCPSTGGTTFNEFNAEDFEAGELDADGTDWPAVWVRVFAAFHAADVGEEFMKERPMNGIWEDRDLFGDELP